MRAKEHAQRAATRRLPRSVALYEEGAQTTRYCFVPLGVSESFRDVVWLIPPPLLHTADEARALPEAFLAFLHATAALASPLTGGVSRTLCDVLGCHLDEQSGQMSEIEHRCPIGM